MSSAPLTGITNSGHTPGPWYVVGPPWGNGTLIVEGSEDPHGRKPIADVLLPEDGSETGDDRSDEEVFANARLIAAAPDLYEALKAAFDWWVGHEGDFKTLADRAARALSKAEGWR